MNALNNRTTRGLAAVLFGCLALTGLADHARADETCTGTGLDCPVWFEVTAPTDANVGSSFTVDITVHFPSGDYRGMALDITVPSGLTVTGSASPTTQEFDNSVAITGGRRWSQQAPLDFSGGAANRRFNITVSSATRSLREGTLRDFSVSIAGTVGRDANDVGSPVTYEGVTKTTTMHGTAVVSWLAFGGGNGGGPILSGETVSRTGILRRFVFLPQNTGNGYLDAPVTYNVSVGSGYYFVRAFGASYGPQYFPDPNDPSASLVVDSQPAPWVKGAGTVTAHTITGNVGAALYVDLFVPCDAFGLTQEESDAQGDAYLVNATVDAVQRDIAQTPIETFHLDHAAIGALNLTAQCGAGGGLNKTANGVAGGGTQVRWILTVSPPFGVSEVNDAMIVDVLPAETSGVGAYGSAASGASFEVWSCNFSAFPGYFTSAQFLARRDANCRSGYAGYLAGDTHVVYYAPTWRSEDGALVAAALYPYTRVPLEWTLANPGGTIVNTAYFNGDLEVFPDVGDVAVEVTDEDRWEARRVSDPVPSASALILRVSRNGNYNSPGSGLIDANGGVGNAYAHLLPDPARLNPSNPTLTTTYPAGIIIDEVYPLTGTGCSVEPDAPAPSVWTSPVGWAAGDATDPWRLHCTLNSRIRFHVDPDYPWIDGQAITFNNVATASDAPDASLALSFVAQVTTGMDVLLSGGCWTESSPVAPPQPGLILFEVTAVNRGSDDLGGMELRFVVPQDAVYRTALPGPDLPVDAVIEVSRDGGSTWGVAPTSADAAVTDVRVTGLEILGEGLEAKRPSFYVGVLADTPTSLVVGGAWNRTEMYQLGQTPTKEVTVDASTCAVPCTCDDPTPGDACSTGGCDATGACVQVNVADQTACQIEDDLCVTAAECRSGACTATATTSCDDHDSCTNDSCNPTTGQCGYPAVYDCARMRPFYLPVSKEGKVVGAVLCWVIQEGGHELVKCDTDGDKLKLHDKLGSACGG